MRLKFSDGWVEEVNLRSLASEAKSGGTTGAAEAAELDWPLGSCCCPWGRQEVFTEGGGRYRVGTRVRWA